MAQEFRFSACSVGEGGPGSEPPDGGGGGSGKQPKKSFRDMVMGQQNAPSVCRKVDLIKEKLARITYEDSNPLKPMVHISESVFEGLCAPWEDALVIKLLGKTIGYQTMRDRLTRIWKLSAGFELMDIGNDFFMVKFDVEGDRTKVMDEGPWMVFDHYLTVRTWTPDLFSPAAKIDNALLFRWFRRFRMPPKLRLNTQELSQHQRRMKQLMHHRLLTIRKNQRSLIMRKLILVMMVRYMGIG